MSIRKLGDKFCSNLHSRHMKAMGFKKQGHNFLRELPECTEKISIQGSTWNSGEEPWHFYVDISIKLCAPEFNAKFGSKYQANGRLERFVPNAPPAFDLSVMNIDSLVDEIAGYINEASIVVPSTLEKVKLRAAAGFYSPLPVPDSWQDLDQA